MPSSAQAVSCILQAIPKEMEGKIVDVGSGWGTLIFPLAKRFPRCRVVGYENSPIPYFFTKIRQFLRPLPNLEIFRRNFYDEPMQEIDLVVCYLYPGAMQVLRSKLVNELREGALIISNTFALPQHKPLRIYELNDLYKTKIYVYQI